MNEKRISSTHSFEITDVDKYGSVEKALIMKEIKSISAYKIRNGHEGWVFYSSAALEEKFSYMKIRSITKWLNELELDGFLKVDRSGRRNQNNYDKTKWYKPIELNVMECQPIGKKCQSKGINDQSNGTISQTIPPQSTSHSTPHTKEPESCDSEPSHFFDEEVERESKSPFKRQKPLPSEDGMMFSEWFMTIKATNHNPAPRDKLRWAETYDKLRRIDGKSDEEIRAVTKWARAHNFWSGNFMSPCKLRDRDKQQVKYYDVFLNAMNAEKQSKNSNSNGATNINKQIAANAVRKIFG